MKNKINTIMNHFSNPGSRYALLLGLFISFARVSAQSPCTNLTILQQFAGHEVSVNSIQGFGFGMEWRNLPLLIDGDFLTGADILSGVDATISKAVVGVRNTTGYSYPPQTFAGILISGRLINPTTGSVSFIGAYTVRTYLNGVESENYSGTSPHSVSDFSGIPPITNPARIYGFRSNLPFDEIRFEFRSDGWWAPAGQTFHAMMVSVCCNADAGSLH